MSNLRTAPLEASVPPPATLVVVRCDIGNSAGNKAIKETTGRVQFLVLLNSQGMAGHDDTVHLIPPQHPDVLLLFQRIQLGVADQHFVSRNRHRFPGTM